MAGRILEMQPESERLPCPVRRKMEMKMEMEEKAAEQDDCEDLHFILQMGNSCLYKS